LGQSNSHNLLLLLNISLLPNTEVNDDRLIGKFEAALKSQRELMIRQNEAMKSGRMRLGTVNGVEMADDTPNCIKDNERRIADIDRLLAEGASRPT
jgi:hypothetical protein